ncbi:hypothetical protein [Paenibacillus sp. MMO-177]|uniref:hypothetical protein n=1 Tax=Paenibacillus sp. MMO-177 TaxID=3081289 RepID=UPI003019DC88
MAKDPKEVLITLHLVKDDSIGYCDPGTGMCVMPVAASTTEQAKLPTNQQSRDK